MHGQQPVDAAAAPELRDFYIGLGVAELLLYGNGWVLRRVESLTFKGVDTVRRQMSIDFELPRHSAAGSDINPRPIADVVKLLDPPLVPLLTLEKRKLTNFDMRREDGQPLPLLTTRQNGRLAGEALVALADGIALSYGWDGLDPEVELGLRGIAMLPLDYAEILLQCMVDWPTVHMARIEELTRPGAPHQIELRELARALVELERSSRHHRCRSIMADPTMQALACKLATDFVVFAPLPEPAFERRIYKLSYDEQLGRYAGDDDGRYGRSRRARRWAGERLAWQPKSYGLGRIDVGDAESHHLELIAPGGSVIFDALLSAVFPADAVTGGVAVSAAADESVEERRDVPDGPPGERAHLHLRDLPSQADGTAMLRIQVESAGSLNAALVVAILIAAIFWTGRGQLDQVAAEDAATALLLAVPSVFAFYIARMDEHALVQHLLSGVRLLVYTSAALAFVAAGAMAFGMDPDDMESLWGTLRFAALVPVAGLSVSWLQLHFRKPRS